jgi:hypothetical protein
VEACGRTRQPSGFTTLIMYAGLGLHSVPSNTRLNKPAITKLRFRSLNGKSHWLTETFESASTNEVTMCQQHEHQSDASYMFTQRNTSFFRATAIRMSRDRHYINVCQSVCLSIWTSTVIVSAYKPTVLKGICNIPLTSPE